MISPRHVSTSVPGLRGEDPTRAIDFSDEFTLDSIEDVWADFSG